MSRHSIFGHTDGGFDMPAYISITQDGDKVEVIVRSPKELGSTQAQISLDAQTFAELRQALVSPANAAEQFVATSQAIAGATPPGQPLSPLHIKLLRRGATGKWIGLSDDMGTHMCEVSALGDLRRAGLVEEAKGPFPPGPPSLPPYVITDAGRAALRELDDPGRPVPPHGSGP